MKSKTDEGDEDRNVVRLLVAGGLLRKRRRRKLLLAHLLRERGEGGEDIEAEGEEFDEDDGEGGDRKFVKALIASGMLRKRRRRKMLLAHLIRERSAEGDDERRGV